MEAGLSEGDFRKVVRVGVSKWVNGMRRGRRSKGKEMKEDLKEVGKESYVRGEGKLSINRD